MATCLQSLPAIVIVRWGHVTHSCAMRCELVSQPTQPSSEVARPKMRRGWAQANQLPQGHLPHIPGNHHSRCRW